MKHITGQKINREKRIRRKKTGREACAEQKENVKKKDAGAKQKETVKKEDADAEQNETAKKEDADRIERALCMIGWILLLILVTAGLLIRAVPHLAGHLPTCLFHELTGFYCPGCGGTRAVYHLTRGWILSAAVLHPVVPYGAAVGGYFLISQTAARLSGKSGRWMMHYHDRYLWIALGIVIANLLIKNVCLLFGTDLIRIAEAWHI